MPNPLPPSSSALSVPQGTMRRVLIVDDSVTIRTALKLLIGKEPGWAVAGTAADGEQAVAQVRELSPDVVVMDYEMPVMNGLQAIKALRLFSKVPVVVLSGHTPQASRSAIDLMHAGASDVMCKNPDGPIKGIDALQEPLMQRLNALTDAKFRTPNAPSSPPPINVCNPHASHAQLMVVGSSTGGPPALEAFLKGLAPSMTAPVVIAQHMPETFTAALAERLNQRGTRSTCLAAHGMVLQPETVYVAPGGQHTQVCRGLNGQFKLSIGPEPIQAIYRPSVDALFSSAAQCAGANLVAAVLTGMGDDGMRGSQDIVAQGGKVVAQDAESCVVYGMPKAVIEANLASATMPPQDLAQCLSHIALRAA